MDAENVKYLFNLLREDISSLKADVHVVVDKHARDLRELEDRVSEAERFHAKFLGFAMAVVLLVDIGFRVIEAKFR